MDAFQQSRESVVHAVNTEQWPECPGESPQIPSQHREYRSEEEAAVHAVSEGSKICLREPLKLTNEHLCLICTIENQEPLVLLWDMCLSIYLPGAITSLSVCSESLS